MIILTKRVRLILSIRAPALALRIGVRIDPPDPNGFKNLAVPPPVAALIQARAAALNMSVGAYVAMREDMITAKDADKFDRQGQLSIVTSADLHAALGQLGKPRKT